MAHSIRLSVLVVSIARASAALAAAATIDSPPAGLFGFTAEESSVETAVEQRFDAQLSPDDLSAWLKNLASEPNQVGAPHDKANAEFVRDQLRQWGWDAQIEVF